MSAPQETGSGLFGLMAEFETPTDIVKAAESVREAGYRSWNAYTPYPVPKLWELMEHKSPVPAMTFMGGLTGAVASFAFITWTQVVDYPWNIGGRPTFSWPAWIPPTFETTILLAGLTAGIGMLAINGFPKPYHPVFNVDAFERASQDRYFLVIKSDDPHFDRTSTESFLRELGPVEVSEVDE